MKKYFQPKSLDINYTIFSLILMTNFSIAASDIHRVLQLASVSLGKESENRLYSLFHFNVKDRVSIFTLNVESQMQIDFDAEINNGGQFSVHGSILLSTVKQFKSGFISFRIEQNLENQRVLFLSSGKTKFKLAIDVVDEPKLQAFKIDPGSNNFSLDLKDLSKMISKVSFCTASNLDRLALSGVFLNAENNKSPLNVICTDGKRLGLIATNNTELDDSLSLLLPKKTADALMAIADYTDSNITCSYTENNISFQVKDILFSSRLIEAQFPNYHAVLPKKSDKIMDAEVTLLSSALRKLLSIGSMGEQIVVKLTINNNHLFLNAESSGNQATDDMPVVFSDDSEFTVSFHVKAVLEMLEKIEEKIVRFSFESSKSPILISPVSDSSLKYVIAPVIV